MKALFNNDLLACKATNGANMVGKLTIFNESTLGTAEMVAKVREAGVPEFVCLLQPIRAELKNTDEGATFIAMNEIVSINSGNGVGGKYQVTAEQLPYGFNLVFRKL